MALSTYGWLGIGGLTALGLYAWSKHKAAAAAPPHTEAVPPAAPPLGGAVGPDGKPVPWFAGPTAPPPVTLPPAPSIPLTLDWRKFGYDLGFAEGVKDKTIGMTEMKPEPPSAELAKAGADPVALRAGYVEGYNAGQASVPMVKTGRWHGDAFVPSYWHPVMAARPRW